MRKMLLTVCLLASMVGTANAHGDYARRMELHIKPKSEPTLLERNEFLKHVDEINKELQKFIEDWKWRVA